MKQSSISAALPSIIFLHIPKSGGTTLHHIIESQYPPGAVYTIDGAHVRESIAAFKALSPEARSRLLMVKGHMAFGLHAWLQQPATYITLVRDPVERAISHYYHIVRTPHHTHYPTVVGQNMSLQDFVLAGVSRIVDNGQVRALAAQEDVPYGECTSDMLAQARANIEGHFTLVGLTERFDETLVLLKQAFGWQVRAYSRQNVGQNRPVTEAVSGEARQLIEELNQYDLQLYHFAEERFNQAAAGLRFAGQVKWFQWGNTLRHGYGKLVRR